MSGGEELSHQLEANGYDWVREQVGLPAGAGDEAIDQPAEAAALGTGGSYGDGQALRPDPQADASLPVSPMPGTDLCSHAS